MSLSVSISTRPCLSPRASACASPICAQDAVSLRPAPAHWSYFGFRHQSPTARRRFLRPPARTTRCTRPALGAPGLLRGIPGAGKPLCVYGWGLERPSLPVADPGIGAVPSPAVRQLSLWQLAGDVTDRQCVNHLLTSCPRRDNRLGCKRIQARPAGGAPGR